MKYLNSGSWAYILAFGTVILTVIINLGILANGFFRGYLQDAEYQSGVGVITRMKEYEGRIPEIPFVLTFLFGQRSLYTNEKKDAKAIKWVKMYHRVAFVGEFLGEAVDTIKDAFYIITLGGGLLHYNILIPIFMCGVNSLALLKDGICCRWLMCCRCLTQIIPWPDFQC